MFQGLDSLSRAVRSADLPPHRLEEQKSGREVKLQPNQVSSLESLSFAVSLLRGESRAWWWVEEEARWCKEEQIHTWDELKIIMSSKYVTGFQWEEEKSDLNFFLKEIEQPDSLPEDSLPMIAAEHEGETQELCLHVPDQTNQEEKVLGESSTTPELAHALIDQGESFQSLSSGLLTCSKVKSIRHPRDLQSLDPFTHAPSSDSGTRQPIQGPDLPPHRLEEQKSGREVKLQPVRN
ncbi:hypothetical protein DY000_02046819 [Brassica cretica]|uniref:Uncharacterized protein n=1 Tax=Brassica cretica TaxID=69181 RepID=A0ABQ7F1B4_BRACR|nr:hypothetical protein DY000_02046819 [Brassica cretica]